MDLPPAHFFNVEMQKRRLIVDGLTFLRNLAKWGKAFSKRKNFAPFCKILQEGFGMRQKTVNFLTLNRWRTCHFLPYISSPVVATMEIFMYVDIHTHT